MLFLLIVFIFGLGFITFIFGFTFIQEAGPVQDGAVNQPRPKPQLPTKPVTPLSQPYQQQPYFVQQPVHPMMQAVNSSMPAMQQPIGQPMMTQQPVDVRGIFYFLIS